MIVWGVSRLFNFSSSSDEKLGSIQSSIDIARCESGKGIWKANKSISPSHRHNSDWLILFWSECLCPSVRWLVNVLNKIDSIVWLCNTKTVCLYGLYISVQFQNYNYNFVKINCLFNLFVFWLKLCLVCCGIIRFWNCSALCLDFM